jgi:hypothetical protein
MLTPRMLQRIASHVALAAEAPPPSPLPPLAAEETVPSFVTDATRLPVSPRLRNGLSQQEMDQFHRAGYVAPLPLFDEAAVPRLQAHAHDMFSALEAVAPGTRVDRVNMWQKANRFCYEISRHPAILDYVESLAGPNFYQWGCHMFVKHPRDGSVVPWHQDAQ